MGREKGEEGYVKGSSYCRYRPNEVSAEQIINPFTDTFSKTHTYDNIS